ncbi:hypothetical protein AB0D10_43155 [Kitasatospora sp. NPDC048545]|uniref:hypothetical protein n=1 Tax=Kitasatospora sp. NPDC048545 TaxID=3157208 RepID=UPI0033E2B3B2
MTVQVTPVFYAPSEDLHLYGFTIRAMACNAAKCPAMAFAAVNQAVRVYRRLERADAGEFNRQLADALLYQSRVLAARGRTEESEAAEAEAWRVQGIAVGTPTSAT